MSSESNSKVVFFIDALGEDFLKQSNFLKNLYKESGGKVISDAIQRVTPSILGDLYTGVSADEHGLLCPTGNKFPETVTRPDTHTIMKQLDDMGYRVLSYNMPFTRPLKLSDNSAGRYSAMQTASIDGGENLQDAELQMPIDRSNIREAIIEGQENEILSKYVDNVSLVMNAVRTWQSADLFDAMFISIRWLDSLVHYCPDFSIHEELAEVISRQIRYFYDDYKEMSDIFVFSDHGGEPVKEKFEVNRWLIDNDYLNIDLDLQKYNYWYEESDPREEGGPAENQININDFKFGEIKEDSICASFDAFDCAIDLLGEYENDPEKANEIAENLSNLQQFRDVKTKWDLFDKTKKSFHFLPEIFPDRDDGVIVSGNLHPNPIGEAHYRSGCHTRRGVWLSTVPSKKNGKDLLPKDLYTLVLKEFFGIKDLRSYIVRQAQQTSSIPSHLHDSFIKMFKGDEWKMKPSDIEEEKTGDAKRGKAKEKTEKPKDSIVARRLESLGYI